MHGLSVLNGLCCYIIITENKQTWDRIITTVIENYNNTPNTALNGRTTNEAHLKANQEIIFNLLKQKGKQEESDLVLGDKVRIGLAKDKFTKSSSPQFSDEAYTVYLVKGSNVKLDKKKTYKV